MQKHDTNFLPKSLAAARAVGHNLYFTGVACKQGHVTYRYVNDRACSACVKNKVKKASTVGGGNVRRWAKKTPEQLAVIYERRKVYYQKTQATRLAERKRAYEKLKDDPERWENHREKANAYRATNGRSPEKSNPEVKRRYKQTAQGRVNSRLHDAQRHAAKMRRTPAWLTVDDHWLIGQAYALAVLRTEVFGFQWHVDHILPLQGKYVSGLHTPANLQVVPWRDNVSKANKYLPA